MFSVGTLWVAKVCMSNQTTHIPSVTTSKVMLVCSFVPNFGIWIDITKSSSLSSSMIG